MVDPRVQLLQRWLTNARRSQIANYEAANMYSRRNYGLGIPAVLFSAVVGTSVFAALGSSVSPEIQITVGIVSVIAAVLGALQTFLRWGELSSQCRSTAAEYGAIKREIGQIISFDESGGDIEEQSLSSIREKMDTLARDAPELPDHIWKRARVKVPLAADEQPSTA
nr:putative integron gene cassette protein [uncultured bacterium]